MPDKQTIDTLITAARKGSLRAFLSKPGGTRYGAAVMTAGGHIFSSGQYSSFNHITNIHAEMAAVLMATMAGEPDIIALALVSTSAITRPARPCGICREFLHEHALRIGHSIEIVMSTYNGDHFEQADLAELLPLGWTNRKLPRVRSLPWEPLHPCTPGITALGFGDQIQIQARFWGLVWEPHWQNGRVLVKVKYMDEAPLAETAQIVKLAHSFTGYDAYIRQIRELGIATRQPWGDYACVIDRQTIDGFRPVMPLATVGLERLQPLPALIAASGIPLEAVAVSGSWACGMQHENSDIDIIVRAAPPALQHFRQSLAQAMTTGALMPPQASNTWQKLSRLFGEAEQLVRQGRFTETFMTNTDGRITRCSLIYVRPDEPSEPVLPPEAVFFGLHTLEGTVTDATEAHYKSARYRIDAPSAIDRISVSDGIEVRCWHKLAGLLQVGDRVRVSGILTSVGDRISMLQLDPDRHTIIWLSENPL